MKTQHTPGPWKIKVCDYGLATPPRKELKIEDGQFFLATLACDYDMPDNPYTVPLEHAQANARLMAAAPELLDALQACHSILNRLGQPPLTRGGHCEEQDFATARRKTVAAIAKATQP